MVPLVSVIVPVYKVEDYLSRCLDSLSRQSLSNIEVLMVDDASPDSCGEICDQYVARDSRFKVFHNQKNSGLSASRNLGIRMASAEYIMFVDSDDWVDSGFCMEAYRCAIDYHADLVIFGYYEGFNTKPATEVQYNKALQMKQGYVTREMVIDHMILKSGGVIAAWNKLYHKSLFDKISFPEGHYFEDIGVGHKILWQASCIYCCDKALYYYNCSRPGSITLLKSEKARNDWLEMRMKQYKELAEWGYSPKNLDYLLKNIALSYFIRRNKTYFSPYHKVLKQTLLQDDNAVQCFTPKRRVLFFLWKYCPFFFESICSLMGKKTI